MSTLLDACYAHDIIISYTLLLQVGRSLIITMSKTQVDQAFVLEKSHKT